MKIFISYAREDTDFAKYVHKYLRDKGHAVFIDVSSIRVGDVWARSIEKNISECDIFVVILTHDSIINSNVEKEVLEAQKQNKTIVPCIHEDVHYKKIKWGLAEKQGIEFSDEYKLARKLSSKITDYDTNISEDIDALNEKGNDFSNQGKYKSAIAIYDLMLRRNPNNVGALNEKGFLLSGLGKHQEAIEYYNKVLEIDPNNIHALSNKGFALMKIGQYQEAIEWFDKALEIDPNYFNALIGKGRALHNQCQYQEAIEWFDKALEVDPNSTFAQDDKKLALEYLSK